MNKFITIGDEKVSITEIENAKVFLNYYNLEFNMQFWIN